MGKFFSVLSFFLVLSYLPLTAETLVFMPQWTAQSQFAGYYVAQKKGFYKEVGLDVKIEHPSASYSNIHRLQKGQVDIISMQLVAAMMAVDSGISLVNILQSSQNNALVLISREPLKSLQDLRGKKVGRWKAGFHELALILDKNKQLDIEWIPFVQNVNLYISGAIDATLATTYNEYFQLKYSGQTLSKENVIYFSDLGYDIPEDGLYVKQDFYDQHKEELAKFVKASIKAWQWVAQHQEEALEIVMDQVRKENIGSNKEHQRWMLREVLSLQRNKSEGTRNFKLSPDAFRLANEILLNQGFIKSAISYQEFVKP